jgi:TP901 family phage tail tape measure protein
MSNRDLNLALRLTADVTRLMGGLSKGETGLKKFGAAAKGELDALGRFAGSVEGKLAQLGLGVSAIAVGMQSAQLDKDLKQLQLTAGATAAEADLLRQSLMDAQIATGQGVDELKGGVDALIAGGLGIAQATATVAPMAETLAVSKTNADALAKAMGVAATQFDIDLSKTEEARLLLDKMVVAGRAGNAELENLPDIFARVGSSAKSSNLSLDQTLALVETLSLVEPNAERLATLTDSTLRVFTNANYMKGAQKATGVKFFDKDGSRRDALEVISDIKAKYDKLGTDAQRFKFINNAFGKTDLDTQRGLKTLLDGNSLGKLDQVFAEVRDASGTIARDLPDAIGNAVDQTNRLKGALREAADEFAKPVNDTLSGLIKWGMDSKENGGLGLDGKDMLLGGAAGAAGLFGAARYGGKAIKGLAGKFGSTAAGVATGKALEEAAGVQPVYVVNMPADSLGGNLGAAEKLADTAGDLVSPKTMTWLKSLLGTSVTALPAMGSGAMATAGAAVAGAGAAGYGVGTLLNDYLIDGTAVGDAIGKAVAYAISPFSEDARNAIAANNKAAASELTIRIEGEPKARVTQMNSDGLGMTVLTGRTRAGG